MPDEDRDQIQTLAVRIFSRHTPSDPAILAEPYMKCLDMGKPYKACLVTGRYSAYYYCLHFANVMEI